MTMKTRRFNLKTLSGYNKTGRPLGTERFVKKPEKALDRGLLPKKAGRPRKRKRKKNRR
ncbi:hypothetical protein KsCSTR_12400 [Candidatus Kuenenia stuttgartiensis]|uniref:Uncharacterized protein n=1 Tax=Kuenenia stuttgartiensis TaxID=174633 RepID=A0A6G7GMS8_KUEST|nr:MULTISPECIES: hypothetical protein [Kuenenia]MBE7547660.1 hypothetical protein [Planctomycetia bacterium]MCZ7624384.1 hypothetical protein [Candidatus Kuenenia sp.]QII10619.1 hypothetical protein KsCSTR_12400 [Candidatus Kuenenia stuttgartiensis]